LKSWLSTLLLLAASGCFYSFDNPVELQDAGSIAGRVVFTENSAGLNPGGGQVGLLWTDLNITVQNDGHFLFLGLPDGVYTVKYELDPGDGGLPLIAFMPGVTLPQEPGNVPDAIDLGTIVLNPVARVTGHVTGLGDAGGAVVGAFGSTDAGEIFESFAVMTDDGGNFTIDLPTGSHDIWASTSAASGSTAVTVPSGKVTDVGALAMVPPASSNGPSASRRQIEHADRNDGDPNGELVGDLVLGLPGFGASATPAQVADAGLVQQNVEINPPPPPDDPFTLASQNVGVGAHMVQTLLPGQLYPSIFCGLKGSQPPGPETLNDIGLANIPTFVGHPTILGQITWLPVSTFGANNQPPPPNYGTGTTSGTTSGTGSGTATGTGTGGSSSGVGTTGGSSSGGGSSGSTTGVPYFDAGPPEFWQELAESIVADGGESGYPFIPIPSPTGPELFYSDGLTIQLADVSKGQLAPVATFDASGGYVNLVGATVDELGVPTAVMDYYPVGAQDYFLTILQPAASGRWTLINCGNDYLSEIPLLVPAPPGSSAKGGPSLYMYYVRYGQPLLVAAIYTTNKPHCDLQIVNSPGSDDGGINELQQVAGGACEVNGNPGACLALSSSFNDVVTATAIDLAAPQMALSDPIQLSSFEDNYVPLGLSAVVTGPPGSQLMTATWYEGYVDPVPGQMLAQRVPVVDLVNGSGDDLPPALTFDAGYDDAGEVIWYFENTLALSNGGLPLVIGTASYNLPTSFYPPPQFFTYDLISGAPFPNLPGDAGVASGVYGYVDALGHPVVGTSANDGATLNAQIWTYAP
jgi:hypothetical protein